MPSAAVRAVPFVTQLTQAIQGLAWVATQLANVLDKQRAAAAVSCERPHRVPASFAFKRPRDARETTPPSSGEQKRARRERPVTTGTVATAYTKSRARAPVHVRKGRAAGHAGTAAAAAAGALPRFQGIMFRDAQR